MIRRRTQRFQIGVNSWRNLRYNNHCFMCAARADYPIMTLWTLSLYAIKPVLYVLAHIYIYKYCVLCTLCVCITPKCVISNLWLSRHWYGYPPSMQGTHIHADARSENHPPQTSQGKTFIPSMRVWQKWCKIMEIFDSKRMQIILLRTAKTKTISSKLYT